MERIRQQMKFLQEIDRVKDIFRQSLVLHKRRENDAEHSWHMAMVAVTLREYFIGKCSMERVLKMILIHDLVEIYAGDTPAFGEERPDKREEEIRGARKIFSLLPEDQREEYFDLWMEFEDCETEDAKYANVCDRYQGLMQNLTSDGHTWRKYDVDLEMVLKRADVIKLYAPRVFHEYVMPEIDKYVKRGVIKG